MALGYTDRRVDYLLIGGGLAAATAAEEIRKQDTQGSILILTDDSHLPYHRPPLSKEYLRGEIGPDGIYGSGGVYVQLPEWYTEQHVEVLRGVEATALDTRARTVRLADGRTFGFQMLLLATGGRPRRLNVAGADLPGVHVLRTLSDADAIRVQLTEGKRVVVVGSGFIGLETAASALSKGAQVTIVELLERAWPTLVSPELSEYFQGQFSRRGAVLRYGHNVTGFVAGPDGHLAGVRIAPTSGAGQAEEIPCDLAIVGVGIQLNTELAASAGLEVDARHGIVVDERLETRAAGVFVAGDAAAYPDPLGGRMHFEHWDNAIASGQAAGINMARGDEPYRHVPYFFSDQFNLSINMLGYQSSEAQIVIRGDMTKDAFTALYVQNGVLRAALMVNDDAQMDLIRELIADSVSVPKDPQQMADSSFDLASLLMPRRR
ncbi:MAG TPA: FAD-dependent oxidoreductase [Ktedonobacteraceae bacterium]|nr:FAD-dependent oxidoreductase [Ktedonobacteraceae bacterium]